MPNVVLGVGLGVSFVFVVVLGVGLGVSFVVVVVVVVIVVVVVVVVVVAVVDVNLLLSPLTGVFVTSSFVPVIESTLNFVFVLLLLCSFFSFILKFH